MFHFCNDTDFTNKHLNINKSACYTFGPTNNDFVKITILWLIAIKIGWANQQVCLHSVID